MVAECPSDEEIDLRMKRADAARVARHGGFHAHAKEIENGLWDHGVAMTVLGPFFKGVILVGPPAVAR
jgi:hypothetical protein